MKPKDFKEKWLFKDFIKTPQKDYFYVNKQNIEYFPASMLMVEKLKKSLKS